MLRARARAGRFALVAAAGLALVAAGVASSRGAGSAEPGAALRGRLVVAHEDASRPVVYENGAILAGGVSLLGPPTVPSGNAAALGPADFTPGPRSVLVLLAQIPGQPAPGTASAIRSIVFTAPNSANAFIQQETFGQISLSGRLRADGDVFGPYSIVSLQKPDVCDYGGWGTNAEQQFAAATGQNPEAWDEVIVVFQASQCDFSGVGEIGQIGNAARHAWINSVETNGVPTTSVLAHELGHNLGVDHAGGFNCTSPSGARISFSEACATAETAAVTDQYLDPFDVMGTGAHEESAYHRWESGWLPASAAQTVTRSGTYLLAPDETLTGAVQLLEVPRGAGLPSYWLDFRQPLDGYFDGFAPNDPAVNGVSLRYANSSAMPHPSKSWLIDTVPGTPTFDDAPLGVGRTYTDTPRGVSITTLSVSALGALVKVTVANGSDTTPPGPVTGLSATYTGGTLHLTWAAAIDDSGTVQHYRVQRNGAALADAYSTAVDDPAPLIGQMASYSVTPLDPAGNSGVPTTIGISIADTTAPSAPTGLAAAVSGRDVAVTWAPAVDDVGVAAYELDRDGQQIAKVVGTSFLDAAVAPGSHVYAVRGVDAVGNAGAFAQVPVTIVVAVSAPTTVVAPNVRVKTVAALKLRRLGKHRVLVSWKAQKGAGRYQVMRSAGKKKVLLATIKKIQYLDGRAPAGKLPKSRYVVRALLS